MGRLFKQYLNGPRIYSCSNCRSHNADHDEIISKAFQGRHGRAYLFNNVYVSGTKWTDAQLLMLRRNMELTHFCISLAFQRECHSRTKRRQASHDGFAHRGRYLLQLLPTGARVEI
mmetsp:Transcript_8924/g.54902  ORF Transcript_8924/g.54902 Transcript_8924/m.54902 type:complete len:116 (+) Transcript_8924:342-689(+)